LTEEGIQNSDEKQRKTIEQRKKESMKGIMANCLLTMALFIVFNNDCHAQVKWIESTPQRIWVEKDILIQELKDTVADITIEGNNSSQMVDGFGACFNELGWTALSVLDTDELDGVIRTLFDPQYGLKLNICRMPIGANDYALNYYSLNDSVNDFNMNHFSIERDKKNLIPYIKLAMHHRPDLKVWGSPWTPPQWMKWNNHYACRPDVVNDMTPDQAGQEGITQFRMEPLYLKAYALYFRKYIEAYRNEGINITGIHVQNEMNSCQNFPSCIWTTPDLGIFIGQYLGPELRQSFPDAEIWYGTYERPFVEKIEALLQDPKLSKLITGVSFQWAGKEAIPGIHAKYPGLKLMQSETECGDGSNNWKAAEYTFSLMKHYFDHGVSVYTFWNSVLDETGKSMWGWRQNSMITIDSKTKEVKYNPEFYLLKHFSFYILPGARLLISEGNNGELLAFMNPDKSIVVIAANSLDKKKRQMISVNGKILTANLEAHSFNTFIIR
jgi:glucosylceramidase